MEDEKGVRVVEAVQKGRDDAEAGGNRRRALDGVCAGARAAKKNAVAARATILLDIAGYLLKSQ